jgi:hypothetical protein
MTVDLMELLSRRPIAHPTRITSALFRDGELRVFVKGWPWWVEEPSRQDDEEIVFCFNGITGGLIELTALVDDEFDEALEDFDISLTEEHEWAKPSTFGIYCSAPLVHPVELYARVEDYLCESSALRVPEDFLHHASPLSRFLKATATRSYLLANGPECIRRLVCEELQAQGVPHTVIEKAAASEGRFLVRLNDSGFFCDAATAEFDESALIPPPTQALRGL